MYNQQREQLLSCADSRGIIRVAGETLRRECWQLVREGLLVRLGYFTFCLPD